MTKSEETLYIHHGVQSGIEAENNIDENGNPAGGSVRGVGLSIDWQDGARATEGSDELAAPNGAFVEDVIWAAIQRLQYFNESKYRDRYNSIAITKLEEALGALTNRRFERQVRNVEGRHEV